MQNYSENVPSLERRLTGHRGAVTGLAFHPDSTQLASSSTDSNLLLWSLKKNAHAIRFENHSDQVTDVTFLPNAKAFVSSSKDRTLRLWKPAIKSRCKIIRAHSSSVRSVDASADSTMLLSASNDKNIKMYLSDYDNKFVASFKGHTHWVNCARFSVDGKNVVSCSEDKTVKLWDRHTNFCTHTFEEKVVPQYVEFHPNNKCIGVGFSNGHIKIYDTRNHKLLQFYSMHKDAVNKLSFHPCGSSFISGSSDGTVMVYDAFEGRVIFTLEGHEGAVTAVTFSPNGNRFATAGADKTVLVWRTNFHKPLAKPLEKSMVESEPSKVSLEGRSRTVDARLSFSQMEEPIVDVSCVQDSPSEEEHNGNDFGSSDENHSGLNSDENSKEMFYSVNTVNTSNCGGGDGPGLSDDLEKVKRKLENIKLDVKSLQAQLNEIVETLDTVDKRISKNS